MDFSKYRKVGKFELSSGKTSSVYYDIKEAMGDPENLREIIREFDQKHNFRYIDVIIGIDYGGIPVAVGLSLYTNIPYAILRSVKKDHGTEQRLEGYRNIEKNRVLLLDDVRTTGNTMKEAKNYLKSVGYKIVATDVVFHRGNN